MTQFKFDINRAYPSIPSVSGDLQNHTAVLEAIREAIEIHERRRGDRLDSFVRLSELQELGVVNIDSGTGVVEAPDDDSIYIRRDGSSPATTGLIKFGEGIKLQAGLGDPASVTIDHDGTDLNISGTNTTDINLTGIEALNFSEDSVIDWNETTFLQLTDAGSPASGNGEAIEVISVYPDSLVAETEATLTYSAYTEQQITGLTEGNKYFVMLQANVGGGNRFENTKWRLSQGGTRIQQIENYYHESSISGNRSNHGGSCAEVFTSDGTTLQVEIAKAKTPNSLDAQCNGLCMTAINLTNLGETNYVARRVDDFIDLVNGQDNDTGAQITIGDGISNYIVFATGYIIGGNTSDTNEDKYFLDDGTNEYYIAGAPKRDYHALHGGMVGYVAPSAGTTISLKTRTDNNGARLIQFVNLIGIRLDAFEEHYIKFDSTTTSVSFPTGATDSCLGEFTFTPTLAGEWTVMISANFTDRASGGERIQLYNLTDSVEVGEYNAARQTTQSIGAMMAAQATLEAGKEYSIRILTNDTGSFPNDNLTYVAFKNTASGTLGNLGGDYIPETQYESGDPFFDDVELLINFESATVGGLSFTSDVGPTFTFQQVSGSDPGDTQIITPGATGDKALRIQAASLNSQNYTAQNSSNDLDLADNDFTIEMWVNQYADRGHDFFAKSWASGDDRSFRISTGSDSRTNIYLWDGVTISAVGAARISQDQPIDNSTPLENPGWHHIAYVRRGRWLVPFIDGQYTRVGPTLVTFSINQSSRDITIGSQSESIGDSNANFGLDDLRVTNGSARYTKPFDAFSLPSAPSEPATALPDAGNAGFLVGDTSTPTTVQGSTVTLSGATTAASTLGVTGAFTASSTADVAGDATVGGTLDVTGAVNAQGAVDLDSTLNVDGASTLIGDVEVGDGDGAIDSRLDIIANSNYDMTLGFFEDPDFAPEKGYGFSFFLDGGINQFSLRRHDGSAAGTEVFTVDRATGTTTYEGATDFNGNSTFDGDVTFNGTVTGIDTGFDIPSGDKLTGEDSTSTAQDLAQVALGGGDPNFDSVGLLADFQGADAATSYTELSNNGYSATFVGDAQLDTAQFKFGSSSLLLDGTGDYVTFPNQDDWNFGSGDFTVDIWMRPAVDLDTNNHVIISWWDDAANRNGWAIQAFGGNLLFGYSTNGSTSTDTATVTGLTWDPNTWYLISWVRSGTTMYMFRDGVLLDTYAAGSDTIFDANTELWIGALNLSGPLRPWNGHIGEVRITKGVARYTSTFTVPTEAYPTSSGSDTVVIADADLPTEIRGTVVDIPTAFRLPRYSNATRPSPGNEGHVIWNTDDGQINVDDGTNWTLPDGTTT